MKLVFYLSFLVCFQMSCKKNTSELPAIAPPIVEKMTVNFGTDGGTRYTFTYNHKGQIIQIVDKDITAPPVPRPDLITTIARDQQGTINKITRNHLFAGILDTSETFIYYLANGNLNYAITVKNTTRDSTQYVYTAAAIHADLYRWDNPTAAYIYLSRTSYEVANGNIHSIKVLSPNTQQPVTTKFYEYDDKTFPFVTSFIEAILVGLFEGQVSNNIKKRVYSYTDGLGNPKTETLTYNYTYQDNKYPVQAIITGMGNRSMVYTYKK